MRQIIFSDVDGTLISQGVGEMAQINISAINALKERGDHFVLVSGRNPSQINDLFEKDDFTCNYIFGNGAGYCLEGGEPIYNHAMKPEEYDFLENLVTKYDTFYHLHTSVGIIMKPLEFFESHIIQLERLLKERYNMTISSETLERPEFFGENAIFVDTPFEYLNEHPEIKLIKVEIMGATDEVNALVNEEASSNGFFAFSSFLSNLEITPLNSTKGNAIQEYMLKNPGKSHGIGDALNDVSMLENVDIAVAVENALDEVKDMCTIITDSAENGGVGKYIMEYIIK